VIAARDITAAIATARRLITHPPQD
jgi:hypothetical protein